MSGNRQQPNMMCEVFIVVPTDLVDHDELPGAENPPRNADARRVRRGVHGRLDDARHHEVVVSRRIQ